MTWLRYINNNGMTEWPGAHQIHDSSHQSINVLALIDLIGDWFPSLQLNPFPTWCLALSDSHSQDSGEHTHDESLTGQVNAHTHTHRVFFFLCLAQVLYLAESACVLILNNFVYLMNK